MKSELLIGEQLPCLHNSQRRRAMVLPSILENQLVLGLQNNSIWKLSDGAGVLLLYSNTLQNKEKQHLLNGREEDMGSCDKISLWDLNVSLLGGYESGFALLILIGKAAL